MAKTGVTSQIEWILPDVELPSTDDLYVVTLEHISPKGEVTRFLGAAKFKGGCWTSIMNVSNSRVIAWTKSHQVMIHFNEGIVSNVAPI